MRKARSMRNRGHPFAPQLRCDVYNLSSGLSQSIQEIIDAMAAYVPSTTVRVTDNPAEVNINLISEKPRGPLSIQRITDDFGFHPSVPLQEGVRMIVEWWREYEISAEAGMPAPA
jgi:UDP-glucose 4-epimerase